MAVVFADFPQLHLPAGGPAEVPLPAGDPLLREWAVISYAPDSTALVIGREVAGQRAVGDANRRDETVWSTDPAVVRAAVELAIDLASARAPAPAQALSDVLEAESPAQGADPGLASAVAWRAVGYLDRSSGPSSAI